MLIEAPVLGGDERALHVLGYVGERDPNAPLGMNYNNLIPVLIKAIQEQQATLNRNEQEIKDLRAQNYALSKRIHLVKRSGRRAR